MQATNAKSCRPGMVKKVKNGAKLLESKMMIIGRDTAEFWPFQFFLLSLIVRDILRWQFFKEIIAIQKWEVL